MKTIFTEKFSTEKLIHNKIISINVTNGQFISLLITKQYQTN